MHGYCLCSVLLLATAYRGVVIAKNSRSTKVTVISAHKNAESDEEVGQDMNDIAVGEGRGVGPDRPGRPPLRIL